MTACVLCDSESGKILWQNQVCRVIFAANTDYSGFCQVISHQHVKEMTDLPDHVQLHLMQIVFTVESAIREVLRPDKINLASLGNQVPHVHWHIIPRYKNDPHFPASIWSPIQKEGQPQQHSPHTLLKLSDTIQRKLDHIAQHYPYSR